MQNRKETIRLMAEETERFVSETIQTLSKTAKLTDYIHDTDIVSCNDEKRIVWTRALQRAVDENEIIEIPPSDIPYDLDGSVLIDGN